MTLQTKHREEVKTMKAMITNLEFQNQELEGNAVLFEEAKLELMRQMIKEQDKYKELQKQFKKVENDLLESQADLKNSLIQMEDKAQRNAFGLNGLRI